jgi:DnaJ C terminal domain
VVVFRDTVYDVLTHIYDTKYHSRTDTAQFNADLYMIGSTASHDFDLIQPIISRSASPSFSPSSAIRQRLLDIGDRILAHSRELHKVLDLIEGREDWSRLSPKPPTTPTERGKEFMRSGKKVTFTPSTGSSTNRSARSSPSSLKATVEDAPDSGEDEESHGVSAYHINPQDFDKLSSPRTSEGRPSPPRVMIRQPTDPNDLEPVMKSLNFEDDLDSPAKGLNMFPTVEPTSSPKDVTAMYDGRSVVGSSSRPQTNEELAEEIRKHEDELRRLRDELHSSSSDSSNRPSRNKGKKPLSKRDDNPFGFDHQPDLQSGEDMLKFKKSFDSTSSSSQYHSAQSKPHSLDYGNPSPNSSSSSLKVPVLSQPRPRPRAATTSSTESSRRPAFGEEGGASQRPYHVSPRYSPYPSPSEYSSPRMRAGGFDVQSRNSNSSRESVYGPQHNISLPTVLENGPRRSPSSRNKKRASWNPNDFEKGGDFTLFDTTDAPSNQNLFSKEPAAKDTKTTPVAEAQAPGTITQELSVTLAELYTGTRKRVQVHRLLPDSMSGSLHSFPEVIDVQIYAGLRPNSRITLARRGDFVPQRGEFGDLIFTIIEKPDDIFTREGTSRNLVANIEISLFESLCGWTRTVTTICGQKLQVSQQQPTPPGDIVFVGVYGMPRFAGKDRAPGERGDLLLRVDVKWPATTISERRKELLRQALGGEGGRSPRF